MKAKILTEAQAQKALAVADPQVRAMLLLGHRAGLRACEVAALDWRMVTDAEGALADAIDLPAVAVKGKKQARRLPMGPDLAAALLALGIARKGPVLKGPKGERLSAAAVAKRIKRAYDRAELDASSHSGRRTVLTRGSLAGLNTLQLQQIAGHSSPSTTAAYVDAASDPAIAAFLAA